VEAELVLVGGEGARAVARAAGRQPLINELAQRLPTGFDILRRRTAPAIVSLWFSASVRSSYSRLLRSVSAAPGLNNERCSSPPSDSEKWTPDLRRRSREFLFGSEAQRDSV
jgi:hypothetical protein